MTNKAIGPTFGAEVEAAGLKGLPFTWGPDGSISFGDAMTADQKEMVLAVYAAHDPGNMKPILAAYAVKKQVRVRDGGIRVNVGSTETPIYVDVATNGDGRGLVTGCTQLVTLAQTNNQAEPTFPWVNNDGSQTTLTASQVMTIGYAVGGFVQQTYATLGAVNDEIANGTITTNEQIDAAAWPANS